MGYDIERFEGEVDEELLCPICNLVLQEPLQAPNCEHAFCSHCILEWLGQQQTCPVDRSVLMGNQLQPVPRILRNLLHKLNIRCKFCTDGCQAVLKLEQLEIHEQECEFNPKQPVPCDQGCGLHVPKDQITTHNCLSELRAYVDRQSDTIKSLQQEVRNQSHELADVKRELRCLQGCIKSLSDRIGRPLLSVGSSAGNEDDEVLSGAFRWTSRLPMARVSRWGGMISTPDAVLQAVIKRALTESGCPNNIVGQLMDNSHERHWPRGLSSLETRQINRRQYENYVCKRIPGKQAVVVLACDNRHMDTDLIADPGLVMIFAHGVE